MAEEKKPDPVELADIAKLLKETNRCVAIVKNWVTFFGVVLILVLIYGIINALMFF